MIEEKIKVFHRLTEDLMFKHFLSNNLEVIRRIIKIYVHDINLEGKIELLQPHLSKEYQKERGTICDIFVKINDNYFIIEMNNYKSHRAREKAYAYLSKIFTLYRGTNNLNRRFYLIDLNNFYEQQENDLYEIYAQKSCKKYLENVKIFTISLEKVYKLYYDELDEMKSNDERRLLIMFKAKDMKDLEYIIGDYFKKGAKERFMENYEKQNSELPVLDLTMEYNNYIEGIAYDFEQKGIKKGRQEGRQEGILSVISNMLKKKLPISTIAELSGESIAEIKKIQAKLN